MVFNKDFQNFDFWLNKRIWSSRPWRWSSRRPWRLRRPWRTWRPWRWFRWWFWRRFWRLELTIPRLASAKFFPIRWFNENNDKKIIRLVLIAFRTDWNLFLILFEFIQLKHNHNRKVLAKDWAVLVVVVPQLPHHPALAVLAPATSKWIHLSTFHFLLP